MINNENKIKNERLSKIINQTLSSIKEISDGSGIVGNPIEISKDITIIPLNKISVGYVIGGGNLTNKKNNDIEIDGTTTGFNISPLGFISIIEKTISFVSVNQVYPYKKILDLIDKAIDKISKTEYYANEEEN